MEKPNVGIVGLGLYLPQKKMTAAEISAATGGNWSEDAVINNADGLPAFTAISK